MESSLGCSRGQRVFGPAHRLGQWQRVEVSEGGTPADVTAVQRPPFTPRMCCYEMMTTAACHPRVEGGLLVVLEWPAMRDHGAEKRRPSQGEEFGMCNWDRAHVPPEVIRPRIGRHEDCRERQPCQCRHGYGPYASAHRVCHGSREAPSARPAPLASVLLFLDTGCQGGLKIISRERVRPLRGRSAHVALAVSEGQTTLRGCGGRGAAWPLTASEGQGLDPLETG